MNRIFRSLAALVVVVVGHLAWLILKMAGDTTMRYRWIWTVAGEMFTAEIS